MRAEVVAVNPVVLQVPARMIRPSRTDHLITLWSFDPLIRHVVSHTVFDANNTPHRLDLSTDQLLWGMEWESHRDYVTVFPDGAEILMRVQYQTETVTYTFCRRRMEEFISQVLAAVGEQWGLPAGEAVS